MLLVSIRKQRLRVVDDNGELASTRISSGQPGFDTPTGVFSILEKNQSHFSNIYGGAPMPFMQRLTWSGVALHAGVVPGYRASHGCIRLPYSFAKSLFDMTKTGVRVIVSQDESQPVRFEHPNLFKPLPAEVADAPGTHGPSGTKVAVNDTGIDRLRELSTFAAVTAAMAEPMPDELPGPVARPRSRAEADRMLNDRIVKLQDALKPAEVNKVAASEKAKTVLKETEAAMATLATERKAIEAVRATVKVAEQKQAKAIQAFEAYMMGTAPGAPAKPGARTEDKEAEFEDAVLDMTIDADTVRADAARREMAFAEVQASLGKPEAARNTAIDDVSKTQIHLRSTQTALIDAKKERERRAKPLSVFVSLKSQRIYIRQGFEPVLDAPMTVDPLSVPVGTHVLTAMRYGSDNNSFEWKLVSAQIPAGGLADTSSRKNKRREEALAPSLSNGPRFVAAALNAIKIPQEIRDRIAELARPGASFIISDRDLPRSENGGGTEFVVLTR